MRFLFLSLINPSGYPPLEGLEGGASVVQWFRKSGTAFLVQKKKKRQQAEVKAVSWPDIDCGAHTLPHLLLLLLLLPHLLLLLPG